MANDTVFKVHGLEGNANGKINLQARSTIRKYNYITVTSGYFIRKLMRPSFHTYTTLNALEVTWRKFL